MDFSTWLKQWLQKHPVKPPEVDREVYTEQVMARIRAEAQPRPQPAWRFAFPRLALAVVAASVAAVLFVNVRPAGFARSARATPGDASQAVEQFALLAALDDSAWESLAGEDVAALAEGADDGELLLLAENATSASEQEWLEQTLSLLEQFDEQGAASDAAPDEAGSQDEWLRELETLDTVDLTAKL